jgi:hypothetical protein
MRYFNTSGPVICEDHYCLPPLERFDLPQINNLIDQERYFVLHAPRQVGKTSFLLALMDYLNSGSKYHCLYVNLEIGQTARGDVAEGMKGILYQLASNARSFLKDSYPFENYNEILTDAGPHAALIGLLTQWTQELDRPLILLLDEIDSLVGDTLIAVLRQLRAGYPQRPSTFPQSVILCGVRDVRDYRIRTSDGRDIITGGSAFNIKAESLRMDDFTQDETAYLYRQHTEETGQIFEPEAIDLLWHLSQGQPWLVNALGYELCFRMTAGQDRSQPITADMVIEAKETLIQRRDTHIDQLADKLSEERVRGVIEPILAGDNEPEQLPMDDVQYVIDLGLVTAKGQLRIANAIYQEVIPRMLTYTTQLTIAQEPAWYKQPDGRLDLDKLLVAFQQFFRRHSEHWIERFDYKEAGPQLLMQAFLQRIVNGGGRVEREYGLGRTGTDLLLVWPYDGGEQTAVIELKILYGSLEETIAEGLAQTWGYMDKMGASDGHLIIFDRRSDRSWDEKIFRREEQFEGRPITVWGM